MTYTLPPTPDNHPVAAGNGSVTDEAQVPVLEVDNVTKSYPGEPPVQALRGVNLTIGQGELVGIVGPSGSGKTTLLQLMGTLDRPTSGHVRITGLDVATMADDDVAYLRATRIGFIFQQFFLAEHSDRVGQRGRRAPLRRYPPQAAPPTGPRRPRPGRPGPASSGPSHPALWRATPTGRHRPSVGRPACHRAG